MKYVVDNDLHIHSNLSSCSKDPEQTPERILQYAKDNGLKTICLANHFWDENVEGAAGWYQPQNYQHLSKAKPLPKADGIKFLFGCEAEMDKNFTLGIARETFDKFDFVVISFTHFHMVGFTIAEQDNNVEQKAKLWVKRFSALLNMDLPFNKIGIAHLTCTHLAKSVEERAKLLDLIDDADLIRLFNKAAKLGVAIEINRSDMIALGENAPSILRIYKIAKECGCKFYCASDAHRVNAFDTAKSVLQTAVDAIGLTEEDKFHLSIDSENL